MCNKDTSQVVKKVKCPICGKNKNEGCSFPKICQREIKKLYKRTKQLFS
jgi:hypothetical protein